MEQAPDQFATADDSADRDPERPDEDAAAGREPTDIEGPEADAAPSDAEPETPEEAGTLEADLVGEPDGAGAERTAAATERKEAADGARDPLRGPGDWYVVHTYAGYENKVKANLM